MEQFGGCLCGKVRYQVMTEPFGVVICCYRFCQRATGSDYMVEPLFEPEDFHVTSGEVATYEHRSEGSGHPLTINFCNKCGTKLFHQVHRFNGCIGLFAGTLDDPSWYQRTPETVDIIFTGAAAEGTVVPAGYKTFPAHCIAEDGSEREAIIHAEPCVIGLGSSRKV